MRRIRYSKYVPDPAGDMSLEDLLGALSDYLLRSGFQENMWYELPEGDQTMDALRRAIEAALLNGECSTRKCATGSTKCRWKVNSIN